MSDKKLKYFENHLNDNWNSDEDKPFKEFLVNKIITISDLIWNKVNKSKNLTEDNIYSGNVGIAYMFWYLSKQKSFLSSEQCDSCLSRARTLITNSLKTVANEKIEGTHSFLFGNSGISLMAGLIFNSSDDQKFRDHYLNLFVRFSPIYLNIDFNSKLRDTLYEGRAGFICAALTANQILNSHIIPVQIIQNIGISVIKSGKFDALMSESELPLLFESKKGNTFELSYGMSGILLSLLCIPDLKLLHPEFEPHIKRVVDYILSKQSSNGSYISEDLDSDPINWCSGSTGICYLMAKALQLWSEDKYKNSIIKFGELLWNRGLTQTGLGISKGITGNGYVFLLLFRCTSDHKYLIRAKRFAQFIFEDNYLKTSAPKRPYSLMEGWAGVVCYLTALMSPESAQMPLFFDIFHKEKTELTEDFATLTEGEQRIHLIKSIELTPKTQNNSTVDTNKN